MKVAERFGQPPQLVAEWPGDWLAVCQTAMAAESGAAAERQKAEERRAKMAAMKRGR